MPPRAQDLDQLIRWHVRKSAPFPIEDAQVTYSPGGAAPDGGREFVVAVARRDVVEQFEGVCADAGAHAGLVDLATFSLVNAVLAYDRRPDRRLAARAPHPRLRQHRDPARRAT